MGTTVNNDTRIYDAVAQTSYLERIQDVLEVFNQNSAGAINLRSDAISGDFTRSAIYKIGGKIEHRDVNSTASVEEQKIGTDESIGVKVPWKYGPYSATEEAFKRRGRSVDEFYQLVGKDAADAVLAGFIEHAFVSLDAAIGSNPDMVASGSFATDHKKVLTKGLRKLGDRRDRIVVFAMDSTAYSDLVDDAIDQKIFEETGVVIYGGLPGTMGKPVLVSDKIPANKIFGLQAGAIEIVESQAPGFRSYEENGKE
ncbi:MAG: major capsid protein, partial [Bartonella sp.]|nr:major capsid protein [Bartonella sp.]